jgi:putative sugar O-methyltransferase
MRSYPRRLLRPIFEPFRPYISEAIQFRNLKRLERRRWRKLVADPNFEANLAAQSELFRNRGFEPLADDKLERIRKAYQLAKLDQANADDVYRVSNEWVPIYDRYMGSAMKELSRVGEPGALENLYGNFMRHDCSFGLHGLAGGMDEFFNSDSPAIKRRLYAADCVFRALHWRHLHPNSPVSDLHVPDVGNPYGYCFEGSFVRTGAEYFHHYALRIRDIVGGLKQPIVAELGGGYGGQAYFLLRFIPGVRYIDFDLPENTALTTYFLMQTNPEKDFVLYGEADFRAALQAPSDSVILAPNFCIEHLPENLVDLFFNSYSLAEMSKATICSYLGSINRATRGHIFHVNHTTAVNELAADDFPIDLKKFELTSREPAMWNWARNEKMDEYEFLFGKKCE